MRCVVVGAGIIGATIAYHLARAGVDIVVVDSGQGGATAQSFGWINASFFADVAHHGLRVAGIKCWARLREDVPQLPISDQGALWWEEQGAGMDRMEANLSDLGYPVARLQGDEVARMEPGLAESPPAALRFASESATDAGAATEELLAAAQRLGARVVSGVTVQGILRQAGTVSGVSTNCGNIIADQVVVAAGNGAPDLLTGIGVDLPMLVRPGVMVVTRPVARAISSVLVTPEGEVRQLADGRLMSPAAAQHQGDTASSISEPPEDIARRTCARLARLVGMDYLDWDEVGMAYRPVPADGLPVIDTVAAGVHVAVMHSGVTLAAICGELITALVTKKASNAQMAMLAPYGIDRFSAG